MEAGELVRKDSEEGVMHGQRQASVVCGDYKGFVLCRVSAH